MYIIVIIDSQLTVYVSYYMTIQPNSAIFVPSFIAMCSFPCSLIDMVNSFTHTAYVFPTAIPEDINPLYW